MKILNISTKEFLKEGLRLGEEALISLNKIMAERGYKLIESNTDYAYNDAYIILNENILYNYFYIKVIE